MIAFTSEPQSNSMLNTNKPIIEEIDDSEPDESEISKTGGTKLKSVFDA